MQRLKELIDRLAINKTRMSKTIGISKNYLIDQLKGRRKSTKEAEMRTYLRNYATEILNFLEK